MTSNPIENTQRIGSQRTRCQRQFFFAYLFSLVLISGGCGSSSPPSIPPPQTSEFIYVASEGTNTAANALTGAISAFQIDESGQLTEIAGSPFKVPFLPPFALQADPKSRFLLVRGKDTLMAAGIGGSHALAFTSTAHLVSGFFLIDPMGRFVFSTDNPFDLGTPIHVYSVTADLSFPDVPGSPFLGSILPAAIDPAGRFIFGFFVPQIVSIQIGASGTLTETSSTADYNPIYGYMHPSGRFFYAQGLSQSNPTGYDVQVYKIDSGGKLSLGASEANFASGKTFFFSAIHPTGNFLFSSVCTTENPTCSIDTLPIDVNTGTINPTAAYSLPGHFRFPALDTTGSRLFAISTGADCTVPGLLTVYSVSTQGKLRATGVTAQTAPCPDSVVIVR